MSNTAQSVKEMTWIVGQIIWTVSGQSKYVIKMCLLAENLLEFLKFIYMAPTAVMDPVMPCPGNIY